MSLLGIDLGTSGVRVAAFTTEGAELVSASERLTLRRPAPGRVELDAEEVLAAVVRLLAQVNDACAAIGAHPLALASAVLGEAVVAVDRDGRALAPAPISMDTRGEEAAASLGQTLGADVVHAITGQPLHPMFAVHKIAAGGAAWRSGVFQYRSMGEFVAARLGAEPIVDRTIAARTGAYDVTTGAWCTAILDALHLPVSRFGDVADAGTVIGTLSGEIALATGLPAGLPIILGAHDQAAAFLGGGGRIAERSVFSFGSSDCLTVGTASRPAKLGGSGLATYPVAPGLWVTLAGTAAGGWALQWLADLLGVADPSAWRLLFDGTPVDPPPLLVLPYLAGSGTLDNDRQASGALVGLTLTTTREQIARAFLESAGYELAKIRTALADRGIPPTEVFAVGTGAKNSSALHVRAQAAGTLLHASAANASSRGAAMLAAIGLGAISDVHAISPPDVVQSAHPDPVHAAWYARQRTAFVELYPILRPIAKTLTKETP